MSRKKALTYEFSLTLSLSRQGREVTSQKVREHAVAHIGENESSPVSYGISLFPEVIEKLRREGLIV